MNKDLLDPFQNYRKSDVQFLPHTPQAALLGLERGVVTPAQFIMKRIGLRPLNAQPYDLEELEWVLAQKELDLETVLLLMEVLKQVLKNPDRDIAQFAAENLTTLENRYIQRVQGFKELLEVEEPGPDRVALLRYLVRDLRILALLNNDQIILSKFYFHQSFNYSRTLLDEHTFEEEDAVMHIILLLDMNLADQADALLDDELFLLATSYETLVTLKNRVWFAQGNFTKVKFQ